MARPQADDPAALPLIQVNTAAGIVWLSTRAIEIRESHNNEDQIVIRRDACGVRAGSGASRAAQRGRSDVPTNSSLHRWCSSNDATVMRSMVPAESNSAPGFSAAPKLRWS
jgi:hypothetical protein